MCVVNSNMGKVELGAGVGALVCGIGGVGFGLISVGSGSPKDFVNNMIKTKTQEVILEKLPSFNRF